MNKNIINLKYIKKFELACLLISLALALIFLSTSLAFSQDENIGQMKGDFICLEVEEGNIVPKDDFNECKELIVFVGMDHKIYTLTGKESDIEEIAKSPKRMMGYRVLLKVRGTAEGNQRAWVLYANTSDIDKPGKDVKKTVTGTIVCIVPDYSKGTIKPFVAVAPCNEYEPHLHVIYNEDGQIYALHGTLESISNIEKSSKRKDVTLSGELAGNNSGWIIVVN